jgi:AcrR family transcriptional regulator
MAAERREQILDAVTQSVGTYGVEGATLERVAAASGFSRGHIRHYLGNREEMLKQFQDRLSSRYMTKLDEICDSAEPGGRGAAVIRFLFGHGWAPNDDSAAINALLWAAARDETVRAHLRTTYLSIEQTIARALRADFPDAPEAECAAFAYELLCLAFAHATLQELTFPAARQEIVDGITTRLLGQLGSHGSPATGLAGTGEPVQR